MAQFTVLSQSHKHSKLIDKLLSDFGDDLSNYSLKGKWMIPNENARNKMTKKFFNDFVIYESLNKSYKFISNIIYVENELIGYGLIKNEEISSMNSINEDENKYIVFIKLLLTILEYVLLSPLRIGFSSCFVIILFNYHQYLYQNIIFQNIKRSIKEIKEMNNNNNNDNNNYKFIANIIELDYVMILNNYKRNKYGTKLVKYLIKQIYDGYNDIDDNLINSPSIYVECDQHSLLFWRSLGFEIIGIIDNTYYNRKYRLYSMLYHKNRDKLNLIISRSKRLFQEENRLNINLLGLSLDMTNNDISNIHFKWKFPMNNIMDLIMYLFKFKWLSWIINRIENVINFNCVQITNYKILEWIIKIFFFIILCWVSIPLFIVIVVLRRFKIGAWD